MNPRRRSLSAALVAAPLVAVRDAVAQTSQGDAPPPPGGLFAVELRLGPKWDAAKRPHEQAFFREHSTNLKRLRDSGNLLVGARYSDKGFIVIVSDSESSVRAMFDADPAVQNQVFAYDIHPFQVFYSGCLQVPKRAA